MKIIIVSNLLLQGIKLDQVVESDDGDEELYGTHKMDCIKCGFKMGEYVVGNLKCFKCGAELD